MQLKDNTDNHLVRFATSNDIPIVNHDELIIPDTAPVHSHMLATSSLNNPIAGLTQVEVPIEIEEEANLVDWNEDANAEYKHEPLIRIVLCDESKVVSEIIRHNPSNEPPTPLVLPPSHGAPQSISRMPISVSDSSISRVPTILRVPAIEALTPVPSLDNESLSQGGEDMVVNAPISTQVNQDDSIWKVPSDVVLASQLPGSIVRIVDRRGKSNNSSHLTCLLSEGSTCEIRYRHLNSIIGPLALKQLLREYEK